MRYWPGGTRWDQERNLFYSRAVQTLATSGRALPREWSMETTLSDARCRVSRRRLMLRIKQTKEIANLIVSHSLVQPDISKSDCLSLSQSKTRYNQISLNLFHEWWSGKVSPSLSILLREIFIWHSKSNLLSCGFSKRVAGDESPVFTKHTRNDKFWAPRCCSYWFMRIGLFQLTIWDFDLSCTDVLLSVIQNNPSHDVFVGGKQVPTKVSFCVGGSESLNKPN